MDFAIFPVLVCQKDYPCILTSLLGLNLRIYSGFELAGFDNQLSLT